MSRHDGGPTSGAAPLLMYAADRSHDATMPTVLLYDLDGQDHEHDDEHGQQNRRHGRGPWTTS